MIRNCVTGVPSGITARVSEHDTIIGCPVLANIHAAIHADVGTDIVCVPSRVAVAGACQRQERSEKAQDTCRTEHPAQRTRHLVRSSTERHVDHVAR